MAYISSSANRWYCAKENSYGQIPSIGATHRIPAVKLTARQQKENAARKDKSGSRTWQGIPAGVRRQTSFEMSTYLRDWADTSGLPAQGPLVEAALGSAGALWSGGVSDSGSTASSIKFASPHGLNPGQAITFGSEIRFVAAVADTNTILVNAPFSSAPATGATIGATATYTPALELPSVSIFDYWSPSTALQRVLTGAAVDEFKVQINGDYHQFDFKGMAQDVIDTASFQSGQGNLPSFPAEPAGAANYSYSVVPGNLGQVWIGAVPSQFFTVSDASIRIKNNLDLRSQEFGYSLPRAISPGAREVSVALELFGQDDNATASLYQAARQHVPVSLMIQLGQGPGQLTGIYLKSLVPEVPEFDDSEKRLKWKFRDIRAQGTADDEIVVAFG